MFRPLAEVAEAASANIATQWPRPRGDRPGDLVEGELAAPALFPSFRITSRDVVFTLGSCFTREIEDDLCRLGFDVPCQGFEVPPEERQAPRPNSVLNQYVPPVMLQELRRALVNDPSASDRCLVDVAEDRVVDMQLFAPPDVTRARAASRRSEVEALYRRAFESDVAVVTLGQTEAWWDAVAAQWCNQLPTPAMVERHRDRFFFHELELDELVETLAATCELLFVNGSVNRILVTVSPVPLRRAWGSQDALSSYVYTKSLLRVAAEAVTRQFDNVDYFPSFEIVMLSDRSKVFSSDRMHLRKYVPRAIVDRLVNAYVDEVVSPEECVGVCER